MYELILENRNGDRLTFGDGSPFQIKEFQGLNPPKATINTNETAFMDGVKYNSSKLQARQINVAFVVNKDPEESRRKAYLVIQPKKYIKVIFRSETLDCFTEGYVESLEVSYFAKKQTLTVSILCPYPYLKNAEETSDEFSAVTPMFHFPFPTSDSIVFGEIDTLAAYNIENNGSAETGLTIELYARGTIANPKIIDYISNEYMELNFTMQLGDLITIETAPGEKKITLLRDGVKTNIFNYLTSGSSWLILPVGGSTYTYTIESGVMTNLVVTIKHFDLYEGV